MRTPPRRLLALTTAFVIAGAAATALAIGGRSGHGKHLLAADSVAVLDPKTGDIVGDVPVGKMPLELVAGAGALWALSGKDRTLTRIDPRTLRTRVLGLGADPVGIAAGAGAIWIANGAGGTVSRLDPQTGYAQPIGLGYETVSTGTRQPRYAAAIAYWRDAWVVAGTNPDRLIKISPDTLNATTFAEDFPGPPSLSAIAVGGSGLWALNGSTLTHLRFRPHTQQVVQLGPEANLNGFGHTVQPGAIVVGADNIWATDATNKLVADVDPRTDSVAATRPMHTRPTSLARDSKKLWVGSDNGSLSTLDPTTLTVSRTVTLGHPVTSIAIAYGRVWIALGA